MPAKLSFGQKCLVAFYKFVNIFVAWDRLPKWLGVLNLLAFRYELRAKNLHDTYPSWDDQGTAQSNPLPDTKFLAVRNSDGMYNDLQRPKMGCAGMRFGRNVPRKYTTAPTEDELFNPNPRLISEKLLARPEGSFKPATIVNLLAAAWIQFSVHDWMNHIQDTHETHEVPLRSEDKWSDPAMKVFKTQADAPLNETDVKCPAYKNSNTAWWDASQIYGSDEVATQALRSSCKNGKLTIDLENGEDFLPRDQNGLPLTGFRDNWWIGTELLHTLFALEHNAIANRLKVSNPTWTNDELFDTARLINCALMAKIHTIEWTPAILPNEALGVGMNANWWGLAGEKIWKSFGRLSKTSEVISGILGSGVDQDDAPYCLTEEFTSVYRLHSLIPDDLALFHVQDGRHAATVPIAEVAFEKARTPFDKGRLNFADVFYSFGINYPGAITIHNMPNFLRDLHVPATDSLPAHHIDMGTVDILRDRERGVPRYNQFRRLFHMKPAKNFVHLTGGDKKLAAEVSAVYNGDIEKVDLLVGCLCEPLPKGFGFSDTAFRVFILMASRRLKSDRFLAGDFKPEIYTHEGIEWIQTNTMKDVLCRHFPELRAPLRNVDNAFAPWEKIGDSSLYLGKETNEPKKVDASSVPNFSGVWN